MSVMDPCRNRLEEVLLNCIAYEMYLSYDPKNDGWAPKFAMDEIED